MQAGWAMTYLWSSLLTLFLSSISYLSLNNDANEIKTPREITLTLSIPVLPNICETSESYIVLDEIIKYLLTTRTGQIVTLLPLCSVPLLFISPGISQLSPRACHCNVPE